MRDAGPRSLLRREIERMGEASRYGPSTSALSSTTTSGLYGRDENEDDHETQYRRSYGLRASPPSAAISRRDVDDPERFRHLYAYETTTRVPRRSESELDPSSHASGRERDLDVHTSSFPRRARVGAAAARDAETRRCVGTVGTIGTVTGIRTISFATTTTATRIARSPPEWQSSGSVGRKVSAPSRDSSVENSRGTRSGSLGAGSRRASIEAFAERRRARLASSEKETRFERDSKRLENRHGETGDSDARRSALDPLAPPRRVSMFDRARGLRGLVNRGNTCFAAACLQALAHTPPLAEFLFRAALDDGDFSPVARELARVVRAIHEYGTVSSARDAHDPRGFFRSLHTSPCLATFADGNQHDSQEFLRFLLDALDESLNAAKPPPAYAEEKDDFSEPESAKAQRLWGTYRARTSGVVVDVFAGQLRSAVTCHACGNASTSYDPFWDLSLPLRGKKGKADAKKSAAAAAAAVPDANRASSSGSWSAPRGGGSGGGLLSRYMGVGRFALPPSSLSVTDCLEAFAEDEPMLESNAFQCPRCAVKGSATKRLRVQRWPRVLVVHLKRFQWTDRGRPGKKIDSAIDVPRTVSLLPYLADGAGTANGGGEARYELFAVIDHVGSSAGGHYTATVDAGDDEWYAFDDERVSSAGEGPPACSRNAYVLFYALRR